MRKCSINYGDRESKEAKQEVEMKKKAIVTAMLVTCIGLAGCSVTNVADAKTNEYTGSLAGNTEIGGLLVCIKGEKYCSEWRDTETGVHYFYTPYGGLTVRIRADGTPYTD